MKFSVIIPVLNGVEHIGQCLDSILDQREDVEIILIDGGSTDGTLEVLRQYRQHVAYMETGRDSGISDAFNRGIRHAHGDLIAILNSDDYWETGALNKVRDAAASNPDAGIFTGWCRMLPENSSPYIKKTNLLAMKRYMSVWHPATFVRKETYRKVGNYRIDYEFAMDSEWIHRAIRMNILFHEIPAVLANMRMGGVSDREGEKALAEYRRSVVENRLASNLYATAFFWLHRFSKILDQYTTTVKIKQVFNRMFNPTVK